MFAALSFRAVVEESSARFPKFELCRNRRGTIPRLIQYVQHEAESYFVLNVLDTTLLGDEVRSSGYELRLDMEEDPTAHLVPSPLPLGQNDKV